MLKKSFIGIGFFLAVIAMGGVVGISAQTYPASGVVMVQKPDGSKEPVEGALVEPYRMDVSRGKLPSTKTNRRGEFNFVGFGVAADIALAISGPGIAPRVHPGVKAGMSDIQILVDPGDGRVLTEDEVRNAVKGAPDIGGQPSAEAAADAAKAQAEFEAQKKEVEDRNKKIEEANAIITASLKAGNEAFAAKNYQLAASKYDEGIAANPDYLGSAPILLNNKGIALRQKAVENYNASVRATDATQRNAAMQQVQDDFGASAEAFYKAWSMLKNATGDALTAEQKKTEEAKAINGAREVYRLMVETSRVDPDQTANAKTFLDAYAESVSDNAAKGEAKTTIGDLFRVTGDSANAIAAYREALQFDRKNIDAMAGLGLSLFAEGAGMEDRAMMQEGLNYMQAFADGAPDNHKLKASVIESIDYLKTSEKLTPKKLPQ